MDRGSSSLNCCNTGCTCPAGRRPVIATVKPASVSLRATPRPMPRVPPVTSATRSLSCMVDSEEGVIAGVGEPGDQQTKLQEMVVTPHAGLPARNPGVWGDVVPSVGSMVNTMQKQALVLRVDCEIGFLQQLVGNGEASLCVAVAGCTQ